MTQNDIEAIRLTKGKYFRCLDTKDWPEFRSVFADHARVDVSADSFGIHEDIDQYVALVQQSMTESVSVHHGHTPEIRVSSSTTAEGIWAMEDHIWFDNEDGTKLFLHGYGHYHDKYEKADDGQWRIVEMRLSRLRRDFG